jgi:hypothetical protein
MHHAITFTLRHELQGLEDFKNARSNHPSRKSKQEVRY